MRRATYRLPLGPALLFSLHGWVTAVHLYSITCVRMPLSAHFALSGIRAFSASVDYAPPPNKVSTPY